MRDLLRLAGQIEILLRDAPGAGGPASRIGGPGLGAAPVVFDVDLELVLAENTLAPNWGCSPLVWAKDERTRRS